ncbi:dihydrofolate reductase family protein [Staphylococcus sp. NAM3COL9]|uniref:dihydrofolate reductase family protein n=1 Tax=Staphylococcus sp. NAM3COL9 TaxID=1667172 RepID=UPI00070AE9F7|nr:dihydrofolate reductase family protein [Staphylococcus sp. NAM3COL9]
MYYFSIDPSGRLGWEENNIYYNDTVAHVVEILTENASNAYKDMLRRLNISYIIAGEDKLDLKLVVKKLSDYLGLEEILVGGGEKINWSFIQEGLCDEIFITQSASADATNDSPSLFEASKYAKNIPITFKLKEVKNWMTMRY